MIFINIMVKVMVGSNSFHLVSVEVGKTGKDEEVLGDVICDWSPLDLTYLLILMERRRLRVLCQPVFIRGSLF